MNKNAPEIKDVFQSVIAEQTHKWIERCNELNKEIYLLKEENKNLKKLLKKLFTTADISYCDVDFLQKIMNALYKKGNKNEKI